MKNVETIRPAAILSLLFLALGCNEQPRPVDLVDVEEQPPAVLVSLEASTLLAQAGERIFVGIALEGAEDASVAALHGELTYDAAALRYLGPVPLDRTITLDNPAAVEGDGRVSVLSFRLDGLGRYGAVVGFEVLRPGFAQGLSLTPISVVNASSQAEEVEVSGRITPAPALASIGAVRAGLEPRELAKLAGYTVRDGSSSPALIPGRSGLGDCNQDQAVDALDLVAIARIAVGLDPVPTDPTALGLCDVNASGGLDVLDVLDVGRYAVGVPTILAPVGLRYGPLVLARTHTCALDPVSGEAFCWGRNNWGQIGDGSSEAIRLEPTPVQGGHAFTQLVGGENHTCGLTRGGETYCWGGEANKGTLGNGSLTDSAEPVLVAGGHEFVALGSATDDHVCGLEADGTAWCWGETYAEGRLGDGVSVTPQAEPVAVSGGHSFLDIATGIAHTCALDTDGKAWCWGARGYAPTPGAVGGDLTFTTLGVGTSHACALTTEGAAYCWGINDWGQLGDGTGVDSPNTPVQAVIPGGVPLQQLSVGWQNNCAVDASGAAYCWGRAELAQIGDGAQGEPACSSGNCRPTAVAVTGGHSFSFVATEQVHTCGLDAAGSRWCWGLNWFGGLGVGWESELAPLRTGPTSPLSVQLPGGMVAGWYHGCGRDSGGQVHCWGWNWHGAFGSGEVNDEHATPVAVPDWSGIVKMGAGEQMTCGIDDIGQAYCAGNDEWGALGIGQGGGEWTTPQPVAGGIAFDTIAGGWQHTCGLDTDGKAYCWGRNQFGQVGDGAAGNRSSPDSVAGGLRFTKLASGNQHTCGLDTSGAAHCWGRNQFGQLGNGSTSDQNTPSAVILGLNFVDLAGSYGNFTCGLTGEGKAYCWGYNRYGQLGDGSTQDSPVPRLVGSGRVFTSLHVGTYAACGIDPGGDTYCWGSNLYGQLGTGDVDDRLTPTLLSGHGQQYQSITMMRNAACGTTVDGTVYCWGLNSSSELGIGVDAYALEPIEVLPLR